MFGLGCLGHEIPKRPYEVGGSALLSTDNVILPLGVLFPSPAAWLGDRPESQGDTVHLMMEIRGPILAGYTSCYLGLAQGELSAEYRFCPVLEHRGEDHL